MSPFGFLTSCQSKKTMFFFLPKTLGQILKVLLERSIAKQAIQHRFPADEKRLADFSRESWDAPWKKRGRTRVHEERSSRSKDFRRPIYGRVSEMMPSSKARLGFRMDRFPAGERGQPAQKPQSENKQKKSNPKRHAGQKESNTRVRKLSPKQYGGRRK